jgi:hypothetical protein
MTKDYRKFKKRLLENPAVRKEYDALQPRFSLIRQEIALRNRLNMSTTVGTWQKIAEALDADLQISLVPKSGAQT